MFTGSKYDSKMNTTEIARSFRADVKAAVRAGEIAKGVKLSIRTDYFSGGSAIRVRIVSLPFGAVNPARVAANACDSRERIAHFTPECSALIAKLEAMLDAYNRKDIDTQTDYFNVRFYGSVSVDWELERDESKIIGAGFSTLGLDPAEIAADWVHDSYRAAA